MANATPKRTYRGWHLAPIALIGLGCSRGNPQKQYEFVVRAHSDPGRALAGVILSRNGKRLGQTDAAGLMSLRVVGAEGSVQSFDVTCPAEHQPPAGPLSVVLRTVREAGRRPEYAVACTPETRALVVAVRAEHGADLPLIHWGREVARTDASGAAHALLAVTPGDPVELTFDTSKRPELRPQSPLVRLQAPGRDDVVVVTQEFSVMRPKVAPAPRRRTGPVRITAQ